MQTPVVVPDGFVWSTGPVTPSGVPPPYQPALPPSASTSSSQGQLNAPPQQPQPIAGQSGLSPLPEQDVPPRNTPPTTSSLQTPNPRSSSQPPSPKTLQPMDRSPSRSPSPPPVKLSNTFVRVPPATTPPTTPPPNLTVSPPAFQSIQPMDVSPSPSPLRPGTPPPHWTPPYSPQPILTSPRSQHELTPRTPSSSPAPAGPTGRELLFGPGPLPSPLPPHLFEDVNMDILTTIDPALLSQSPPHFDTTDGDVFNRGWDSPLAGSRSSSSSSRSTLPEIPLAEVLKRKRRQTRSASGEKAQRLHQDNEDKKEEEEVTPQWTPEFKPRPSKRIKLSEFAENVAEGSGTQQDPIFVDIDLQTIWSLKKEETIHTVNESLGPLWPNPRLVQILNVIEEDRIAMENILDGVVKDYIKDKPLSVCDPNPSIFQFVNIPNYRDL
ncbi:hypothetical protein CPB83DRAFT_900815 [Crepidotus variabilis]|uniref:Uncharacterized protein n=1 Tax=Crepidotus variabilis TaxID=179855 RepID=A0A9P6E2I8_9AGAR|nr:hypothetical protein CPB83DRAFT_900815 [Crepidotus variabilis]